LIIVGLHGIGVLRAMRRSVHDTSTPVIDDGQERLAGCRSDKHGLEALPVRPRELHLVYSQFLACGGRKTDGNQCAL
jgi:hypothetical protein